MVINFDHFGVELWTFVELFAIFVLYCFNLTDNNMLMLIERVIIPSRYRNQMTLR